jgi:hypothetical protein
MRPVALDRYFPKLSKNIKFTRFGLANLKLFNFKVGVSIEKDLKEIILIQTGGLAGKRMGRNGLKRSDGELGRPSSASSAQRAS